MDLWLGVFAPAGTPPAVLARLNSEVRSVLQDGGVRAAFAKVGVEPRGTSLEEGAGFVREEYEKWSRMVHNGKLKEIR